MKTMTKFVYFGFASLALACFTLSPTARAVVPAPDGGYPGFTTAEGTNALKNLTTGIGNTATGWYSLFADTAGNLNTANGAAALFSNTGDNNTATGALALFSNATGIENTATGSGALQSNTTGDSNTATGFQALHNNTGGNGNFNTATGFGALYSNTTGGENTAVGHVALGNNTTGNSNIALGVIAGSSVTTANNVICIGAVGDNVSNSCYIGSIAGQTVGDGGTTCYVDNNGKLGVFLSARRFKTDIADMGAASEALLALRPVTFHYKPELDKNAIPQFGLVAEEVAKVNPDLVTHDAKGELSTVRYEAVNAMLLNEFLKEHREVQELKKQVAALTAGLQKVSAQIEASKSTPQMVLNHQ